MDKKCTNDVLRRNVALLSKIGEKEAGMMPAIEAPLPSVEQVKIRSLRVSEKVLSVQSVVRKATSKCSKTPIPSVN